MAAPGTKKGKTKWKPVDAAQIINPNAPRKLATSSWADESNDIEDTYDYGRKTDVRVNLPTAPRAARGPENDANIPKEPPFQAYLSNLSYDVTEEDLAAFFAELKVKSVRLPKDDRGITLRAKGFGYVEFEDRNSLIEALSMPDTTCKNRRMRIEVAENGDQGRGGRGGPRDRDRNPNEPDRTLGDWRSGPRSDAEPAQDRDGYRSGPRREYGSSGGGMYDRDRRGESFRDNDRDRGGFMSREGDRPRDNDRDRGFMSREGDRPRDNDRGGFMSREGDRFTRDTRGFRDDRGGGGFREDRGGGGFRDGGSGGGFRSDRGGGSFREDRGSGFRDGGFRDGGFERRGFDEKRDDRRDDRRGGGDFGDKGGWRRDPEPRDAEPPPERSGEPKTRQRLNLQPRTKPAEDLVASENTAAPTPAPAPSASTAASIFGGAKPVDTAAREREIEERLAKQKDDRPAPASGSSTRDESRESVPQPPSAAEDHPASSPPLEPAPPPKENVWARRSQHTGPSEVNNGRISPHEDGETHKHQDSSQNSESRKYQPPRRNTQEDKKRDDRGPPRGGGTAGRGGGTTRSADLKQNAPTKLREQKKETSDDTIKMPKVQEHAPNFIGSNKYAFLDESENAAE